VTIEWGSWAWGKKRGPTVPEERKKKELQPARAKFQEKPGQRKGNGIRKKAGDNIL